MNLLWFSPFAFPFFPALHGCSFPFVLLAPFNEHRRYEFEFAGLS